MELDGENSDINISGVERSSETMRRELERRHADIVQYQRELERQLEAIEKGMKPIPEVLFHVTTKENAEQILKEGLDPSKLMFENREVVSLSDDINFALGVAKITQGIDPKKLVVLEIYTKYLTPSRIHNYLRSEDPSDPDPINRAAVHEVHYESTITPEAIKIHKPKE